MTAKCAFKQHIRAKKITIRIEKIEFGGNISKSMKSSSNLAGFHAC